jgi:hypothetical protein
MKVFSNEIVTTRSDLYLKEEIHELTKLRKERTTSYIAATQIWHKITLSVATIVHSLQRLADSNPNRD